MMRNLEKHTFSDVVPGLSSAGRIPLRGFATSIPLHDRMLHFGACLQGETDVSFHVLYLLLLRHPHQLSTGKGGSKSRCDIRGMLAKFWK